MGQRHQIYLRLPKTDRMGTTKPAVVVGIHNQWLWGVSALSSLSRFLTFATIQLKEPYPVFENGNINGALDILANCYAINHETGYFAGIYKLSEDDSQAGAWLENPDKADNNNGITLIDLTSKKPKYCFMSVHHLECLSEAVDRQQNRAWDDTGIKPPFHSFDPMNAEKWISLHYSTKELNKYDGPDKDPLKLIRLVSEFEVMTVTDCCNMFPALKNRFKAIAKVKAPKKAKARTPRKTTAKLKLA